MSGPSAVGGVMDRDLAATLTELVGDLRAMDVVGAIELARWPAAARLVALLSRCDCGAVVLTEPRVVEWRDGWMAEVHARPDSPGVLACYQLGSDGAKLWFASGVNKGAEAP